MELVLRGSEYQDFLNCRKKWYYSWVEKIEPKRPDNKLFFGTVFHKFLEFYYLSNCDHVWSMRETTIWMGEQDMSGLEQFEIDDLMELLTGVAINYNKTYGDKDKSFEVLGTEVEFLIKLDEEVYMTGTIDLIYSVDGKIRFSDHKTVASIQMYVDKAQMDRQISRYWWALEQVASGVGLIKNKITGEFEKWDKLLGKEIDGFDYNLIAKDFPKQPKELKPKKGQLVGALSQDKSQKTTYDLYLAKLDELGHDIGEYADFLAMLKDKPDLFLNRLNVLRAKVELEASAMEFLYTGHDIAVVRDLITDHPVEEMVEQVTYRNIGNQCFSMCNFTAICKTAIEGGNVSLTKNLAYRNKEEKK